MHVFVYVCWWRAIHTCFLLLYRCCCRRWWALMSSTAFFLSCPWISQDIEGIESFLINKRQNNLYYCHVSPWQRFLVPHVARSDYSSPSLVIIVLWSTLIKQLFKCVFNIVSALTQWRLLKHFRSQTRNLTYQPLYQASHLQILNHIVFWNLCWLLHHYEWRPENLGVHPTRRKKEVTYIFHDLLYCWQ